MGKSTFRDESKIRIFINQSRKTEYRSARSKRRGAVLRRRLNVSSTRLVAPNYARKDFSLNLVLPVPEFAFSGQRYPWSPIPTILHPKNLTPCRRPTVRRTWRFTTDRINFRSQSNCQGRCIHGNTVWEGERHFVPVCGVSESATNLYLPHPGLRRDHYQSFLLNCGSPGVWSICRRCSLPVLMSSSNCF